MKKFTSLVLILSLCVVSVGCGGAATEGTGEAPPANAGNPGEGDGGGEEAADDAGVVTDDALMSEGEN